ncbi:MAG: hypothetical protein KDC12_08020 [Flavobacteriales bacterium]|nr:hypothetical protein [Flavobacteriales bacterium]
MMDLFLTRKDKFHDQSSLEDLHNVTLNWESQVQFWKDEIRFFQDIIDKYFLQMVSNDNLDTTTEIVDEMSSIRDRGLSDLMSKMELHEEHLSSLMNQEWSEEAYRKEHIKLAQDMHQFNNGLVQLKQRVFNLVEDVRNESKTFLP